MSRLKALLAVFGIFGTVLAATMIRPSAAHADWAHDRCSYATMTEVVGGRPYADLIPGYPKVSVGQFDRSDTVTYAQSVTHKDEATMVQDRAPASL